MKKIIAFILIYLCFDSVVLAQYTSENISLLGHWYNATTQAEPVYGIKYNSVWGWADDEGKEYAILGSSDGTYFIDISNPIYPIVSDYVKGKRDKCIWHEYKTYGKYLYGISDDQAPNSFQIIDMSYLPDSVHVVYDDTTLFERAHTLFIDGDKLYCANVKLANFAGNYSMAVFSLTNPELPTLIRTLNQDDPSINGVHDMFVRNDTVYASCGFQGLFIYYLNSNNTFIPINSITSYPNQGYNHSSALTPDGKTMVFCDEVPANMAVKTIDLTDIQNINVQSVFKSNEGATPHNPYMFGGEKVVIAYYQDGLQIYDLSIKGLPLRTGFFDTDTLHGLNDNYGGSTPYHGCWGAYVNLPSKNILASDMQNGLYILNANKALGIKPVYKDNYILYPNPTITDIYLGITLNNSEEITFDLYDLSGRKINSKSEFFEVGYHVTYISTEFLTAGIYILKANGTVINFTEKIIKN